MSVMTRALRIDVDGGTLDADLALPQEPRGIDDVCDHATAWFDRHCPDGQRAIRPTLRSRR